MYAVNVFVEKGHFEVTLSKLNRIKKLQKSRMIIECNAV